jgi:hypothetical protein
MAFSAEIVAEACNKVSDILVNVESKGQLQTQSAIALLVSNILQGIGASIEELED